MFEAALKEKFERIFDLRRITFDKPSESKEQEVGFIEITSTLPAIKDGKEIARVSGRLHVFASSEKLPFGYFAKQVAAARLDDTKDFFFFEFDASEGTFGSLVNRTVSFVYLYENQYDPDHGEITSVNFSLAETL